MDVIWCALRRDDSDHEGADGTFTQASRLLSRRSRMRANSSLIVQSHRTPSSGSNDSAPCGADTRGAKLSEHASGE